MSNCNACLRRAYTNLHSEISPDAIFVARRNHSTVASIKKGHHRRVLKTFAKKDLDSIPPNKRRSADNALTKGERRDALARDRNKSWLLKQRPAEKEEDDEGEDQDDDEFMTKHTSNRLPHSRMGFTVNRELKGPSNRGMSVVAPSRVRDVALSISGKSDTPDQKKLALKDQRTVDNYLMDPLRLADAVLERLKVSDIDGALRYVRASENASVYNVVSWNHCMDWLMAQGEMKEAIALYNDMKKRGRKPDAHTFTIMLRGLSAQVHKRGAVTEAVKIYNSMFAVNSAVTPNTIHTNAIINVCARGGDMDALWSITAKMPERGPGSPDRITYTTIFNAIRDHAIQQVSKLSGEDSGDVDARARVFQKAVEDARKIWEDVSYRWRRADLILDEQVVCAMGRVLHGCGVAKDMVQILDLVEVTMNLRIRRPPSPFREKLATPAQEARPEEAEETTQNVSPNSSDLQSVMPMTKAMEMPLSESNVYAKPGQRTLSLLLDACIAKGSTTHLGTAYWDLLTNPNGKFRVRPDAANILSYLRILRRNHASQAAYELLAQQWPDRVAKDLYRRGPFVVAIRACIRDKNNPNVFRTAMKIVDLMQQKLEERSLGMFENNRALADMHGGDRKKEIAKLKAEQKNMTKKELDELAKEDESVQRLPVDPFVLASLLDIATRTTKGWQEGVRGLDMGETFERDPTRNHTLIALKRVGSFSLQLKNLILTKLNEIQHGLEGMRGRGRKDPRFGSSVGDDLEDLVRFTRTFIGVCTKVVQVADRFKQAGRAELDGRMVENCKYWMRMYGAYLTRVEQTLGPKFFKQRMTDDAEAVEDDEVSAEELEDDIAPLIERQIRAALGEATTEMMQTREVQKGRPMKHIGDMSVPPKFKSRVMERQYENKVGRAMKARDLLTEFEPIDLDGAEPRNGTRPSSSRSDQRPMIGDELDLDDSNVKESRPSWNFGDDVPFAADNQRRQSGRSRILNRPDVKRAWHSASQQSLLRSAAAAQ